MLKIHFLHKNKLSLTNTYYYAFYSSTDNFDDLSELEKEMIRKASGDEGYVVSRGEPLKYGFREKGIEYLKSQKIGNLVGTAEDLYFEFLTTLTELGKRKAFDENYNADHEKSGADYNIDSFVRKLILYFIKSKNSDKKNQSLYIDSFNNDDERPSVGTIDIDLAQDSITSTCAGQASPKQEIENIANKISFRDSLLLLKFFEKKLSLNSITQYIKAHDVKTNYAEISAYVKKGEGVKRGTLPRLNFEELALKDGRSSFLKKLKRLNEEAKLALNTAMSDFLKVIKSENLQLTNIPDDLIADNYIYSLRNDTFLDLVDYIKNRRSVTTASIISNGVEYKQKESECDVFKLTIDAYNNLNCELTCHEIVELLNANTMEYKLLYDKFSAKYTDKIYVLKNKAQELKQLDILLLSIDKGLLTRKLGKSDRFLTDQQMEKLRIQKKVTEKKLNELRAELAAMSDKENVNPNEMYNKRYIKYLKMFKTSYLKIHDIIATECAYQLMDDTKLSSDPKKSREIFESLQNKYGLAHLINTQDFLSMGNKCQLNNMVYKNASNAKWHNLGDGWLGMPLTANLKPVLIGPDGIIYKPHDRVIKPAYTELLGINYNVINSANKPFLIEVETLTNEYVAFVTEKSEALRHYINWRNDNNAKNK